MPDCLVVGTGWTVRQDLDAYGPHDAEVMAVNQIGVYLPEFTYWTTCHPEHWPRWEAGRIAQRLPVGGYIRCSAVSPGGDRHFPLEPRYARVSGIAAALVALELHDKVVLAGMPADNGGYFYPGDNYEHGQSKYLSIWRSLGERYGGRLRSLSGNTKEILGSP